MDSQSERRAILSFLKDLRAHNDRDWFEAQRPRYEAARSTFLGLVGEIIASFGAVDELEGATPKDCVFRINRDVRFGKDKSPYKSTMSALIGPLGRKSGVRSYYFHLEPGASMLAGGLHAPSPAQLGAFREAIAHDSKAFKRIVAAKDFKACFGELAGETLKTAPQGYAKDHPDIDLLRLKTILAIHPMDDDFVCSADLVAHSLEVFKAMKPFLLYLERAAG
ncbi:MAG TPA: DUF2461 domain-containing protein [Rectinemataceae bacterium]|nr:DUF2461 domain-containing protein [Rectinemataceae bacterium]